MNPALSKSDQGAPSYLKVGFMGFKEFGSGDGPLPQSPGFVLFFLTLSVAQTTKLYICVKTHRLQSRTHAPQGRGLALLPRCPQIIVEVNGFSYSLHSLMSAAHMVR